MTGPSRSRELAPEEAAPTQPFDVVVLQRPDELDAGRALDSARRPGSDLPAVYVEHNAPQGRINEMRHPAADLLRLTLVHVTHFNALFWDTGTTPTPSSSTASSTPAAATPASWPAPRSWSTSPRAAAG